MLLPCRAPSLGKGLAKSTTPLPRAIAQRTAPSTKRDRLGHFFKTAVAADRVDVHQRDDANPKVVQQQARDRPSYSWLDQWYPVCFVRDIDKGAPYRFTLMGIPLVIWCEPGTGSWRAFKDVCPHRLVPLSEGRINAQGLLECGYHGWAFAGDGQCKVIPQAGNCNSPRACATAYPCAVRQGLLFVKPMPLPNPLVKHSSSSSSTDRQPLLADEEGIPTIAELDQPGWVAQDTWRDVPLDWSTVLENVLDASHVPFTHHKSISNRNVIGAYDIKLTSPISPEGFTGVWTTGPRAGSLGPQTTTFRSPCTMEHKICMASRNMESMVVVYAVPSAPGYCRLINRNTFKFGTNSSSSSGGPGLPGLLLKLVPEFLLHIGTQVPLEDDQIFLHQGELEYAQAAAAGRNPAQAYYMPSTADAYVLGLRTWMDKWGEGGPFGSVGAPSYLEHLPPRLSRDKLLDRYSQHTANCTQCQRALKKVNLGLNIAAKVGYFTAAATCLTAAVAVAGAAGLLSLPDAADAGTAAAAAAAGSAGGGVFARVVGTLASGLLLLGRAVAGVPGEAVAGAAAAGSAAGAGLVEGLMVRALGWGIACASAWGVHEALSGLQLKFYKGDYPPQRNLDKS